MSEFSESYHLYGGSTAEGMALLKKAGLKGFVFPQSNGWVTLVAEGPQYQPNERLINSSEGILLHLANAGDHGWSFSIYRNGNPECFYECSWEEGLRINDSGFDRQVLLELVKANARLCIGIDTEEIDEFLYPDSLDEMLELGESPAALFSQLVGLDYYEWVSYRYVEQDRKDKTGIFDEVTAV